MYTNPISDNGRTSYQRTGTSLDKYTEVIDESHGGGGGGGSTNYNELSGKPKINGVIVEGNQTSEQLKLAGINAAQCYATMPAGRAGMTVMYIGEDTTDYTNGHIYRYTGTTWSEIYAPPEAGEIPTITEEQIDAIFEGGI